MKEKLHISYVILTWNSEKSIFNCLNSLLLITGIKQTIIIVDNGSGDETVNIIRKYEDELNENNDIQIKLLSLDRNKGTTVSRNAGLQLVPESTDYICILDSDTQVNKNAIVNLTDVLEENPKNAIAGPIMKTLEGVKQISGRRIPTFSMKILKAIPIKKYNIKAELMDRYSSEYCVGNYPVGYLMSACWMIRVKAFQDIGYLDEKIFYAPEDVEYCIRAWKKGWRVIYCQNAEIIHEWQRLSKKKLISKHNWEHLKGLIYLYKKYHFFFNNKSIEKMVR